MEQQKYTCPMHPQIMEDEAGSCPICGMTLVLTKAENNHSGSHHNGMIADFKSGFM